MIKSIHRRYRGDIINYNRAPRSSQLYLVWTYNHVLTKVVSLTKNCEKGKIELKKHIVQYFTKRCGNNNNLAPSPNPLGIKMSFFKLAYCNWLSCYGFLSIGQPKGLPWIPHNFLFIAFGSSFFYAFWEESVVYTDFFQWAWFLHCQLITVCTNKH